MSFMATQYTPFSEPCNTLWGIHRLVVMCQFGGYIGMKRFISFGSANLTAIEGTDDSFVELWNTHCAGK